MRVGFVGLGVMGAPMAENLLHAGFEVQVYNRTPRHMEPLAAAGAYAAGSLHELAANADVVAIMVTDGSAVQAVCAGGLFDGAQPGAIFVDFSTIGPTATAGLAAEAARRRLTWLDAPVTGGDVGAREATLTIMVGGDADAFAAVRPLLAAVGQRIVHAGPSGAGQSLKLVANLVSGLNLLAAAEGVRLAEAAGIAFDVLAEVLPASSARSFEVDKLLSRWPTRALAPGFSLANRTKDLRLALEMAEGLGFPTVLAAAAHSAFARAAAKDADADETSIARYWDGVDSAPGASNRR